MFTRVYPFFKIQPPFWRICCGSSTIRKAAVRQCTYVCIIEIRNTRVTSRPRHWGSRACITKQRTQISRCTHEFRSRCLNYTGCCPIRQQLFPFLEQLTNRSGRFGQIHGKSRSFPSPSPVFPRRGKKTQLRCFSCAYKTTRPVCTGRPGGCVLFCRGRFRHSPGG